MSASTATGPTTAPTIQIFVGDSDSGGGSEEDGPWEDVSDVDEAAISVPLEDGGDQGG